MDKSQLTATDFEKLKDEALRWTSKSEQKFKILTTDEIESRIDFHIPERDISFYIIIHKSENRIIWHVWSDKDELLIPLNPAIEKCTSCATKSLTSLLDSVSSSLAKIITTKTTTGASKDSDDDNDDDDEFIDCNDEDLGDEEGGDDDDDDDDYYNNEALGDLAATPTSQGKKVEDDDDDDDVESFFEGDGNATAIARLVKDMKNMQKIKGKYGIEGMPKGDNLFVWDVKLTDIPSDSLLGKDLKIYSEKYKQEPVITLEMQFPKDYPFGPPFIRVIRPRFQFLTGHVTIGGSICMQMLTKSGWSPSNDIELILIQVRSEILSDKDARLATGNENTVYSQEEARHAFDRMVQRYGWNK